GVLGLAVPEAYGGSGYGLLELGLVIQEAGRALFCAPLLASSIAAQVLLAANDEAAATTYLPAIADGTTVATLAAMEGNDWDEPIATSAEISVNGARLTGTKSWVLDAQDADLMIVSAVAPAGLSLFLVDPKESGIVVKAVAGIDPTRRQATVSFTDTPAVLLGAAGAGESVLSDCLDIALILLAAEQLGIAERCLEMATEYAKERTQFGRAIGSFQAIKHKLADVLLEVEAATSAVMYALWAADHHPSELPQVAAIAAVTCSEAALLAAGENIQVHGGIGATWEHPAHLYLKRATTDRYLLGDPQHHLERLASLLDA
ncbi:MAG: putative acyl-CoA dehydrogenase, partial [Pseudonocardiales bacterium]|nr:putative acyl-CoA dehydrogenase [Pseudonocardiales bacterium]